MLIIIPYFYSTKSCPYRILHFTNYHAESIHKGVALISARETSYKQQRHESPTVTLTWHACKYKVYKHHQRYILFSSFPPPLPFIFYKKIFLVVSVLTSVHRLHVADLPKGSRYRLGTKASSTVMATVRK